MLRRIILSSLLMYAVILLVIIFSRETPIKCPILKPLKNQWTRMWPTLDYK